MKRKISLVFMLLFMFVLGGCSTDKPSNQSANDTKKQADEKKIETVELTISAAASLEDAFNEIKPLFEKENKDIKLLFNFGGSGALQKQIVQGAPVDLFFSAAEDKYDELVEKGLIDEKQGIDLLNNSLVLIIPKESKNPMKGFEDLAKLDGKLALGTPDVPAGNYGKQTLENLGIWNKVQDQIVFAKDVRQVLTYVETGNVNAGLVYQTDALTSDKVEVVAEAKANSHDPIVYPVGIIKSTKHMDEAERLYQFLQNDDSKNIFVKYGFKVLD